MTEFINLTVFNFYAELYLLQGGNGELRIKQMSSDQRWSLPVPFGIEHFKTWNFARINNCLYIVTPTHNPMKLWSEISSVKRDEGMTWDRTWHLEQVLNQYATAPVMVVGEGDKICKDCGNTWISHETATGWIDMKVLCNSMLVRCR